MDRILEPELMEADEQARAYAEADFEEAHDHFVTLFQEFFAEREIEGPVLDLGCGPGDVSIRFARAYPRCVVHGVDASREMLAHGKTLLSRSDDVADRVQLIEGYLPDAVMPRDQYNVIISNSLLHHLPDPSVMWRYIRRHGESGTPVFVMDLVRPSTAEQAQEIVDTYAPNEPEVLRCDFYNSLRAAFEVNEVHTQLEIAGLSYLALRPVSDRHVVVAGYLR